MTKYEIELKVGLAASVCEMAKMGIQEWTSGRGMPGMRLIHTEKKEQPELQLPELHWQSGGAQFLGWVLEEGVVNLPFCLNGWMMQLH